MPTELENSHATSVVTLPEREASVGATSERSPTASPSAEACERPHRRVLHIVNGEVYAGAERVQDLMADQLPAAGYDVEFACLKEGKFATARRCQATPLATYPMSSRFDLRPARSIARRVREGNFDLIHTHTPRSAMIGRLVSAWTGVPMVHHVHSPTVRDSTHPLRNRLNALIERWSIANTAGIVSVSNAMQRYTAEHRMTGRTMAVVPNGVPARDTLVERVRSQGVWTIGTVALFRPRKGLDVLLEALAKLRQSGYPVRLRAVGPFETADYEAETKALVDRLGIAEWIDWRGFQSDIPAELAQMDLFVLPSLFGEGLPMVILESMSAGVPVVSTSVEGIPEAVRDGQEGIIVTPGDADDLARGIQRVLDGTVDWNLLRRNAYERQRSHYTDVTMARGVAAVYDRVLEQSKLQRGSRNFRSRPAAANQG